MSTVPAGRLRPFQPMTLGRYRLLSPLATGGMGELFLAQPLDVGRRTELCVIKRIRPEMVTAEFVARFLEEAKTLAQLAHTSIGQILDLGVHEGQPFLALEYVPGKDLRKVLARAHERGAPLPLELSLFIFGRVLEALSYAHQKMNLVHRDVSPANVVISYDGDVKVIDFGLAKTRASVERTHPRLVIGKYLYMAPEQARRETVDARSDVYSAGVLLYELLSGKHPWENVPQEALMPLVIRPRLRDEEKFKEAVPPPLRSSLFQALDPDPETRLPSASVFWNALEDCGALPAHAGPDALAAWMRDAFAAECVAERKLLTTLGTAAGAASSPFATPGETAVAEHLNETRIEPSAKLTSPALEALGPNLRWALAAMAAAALLYFGWSAWHRGSDGTGAATALDDLSLGPSLAPLGDSDSNLAAAAAHLNARFASFQAKGGCSAPRGGSLCARFRELSEEVARGGESTTLVQRVRDLSSELDDAAGGAP
ncbi:MAG: serine/threonine protein kinase [Myxococcaceae bacterium]